MNIGYASVSTGEQSLDLQADALENANCKHIFQEAMIGAISYKPELEETLKTLITKGYQSFIGNYE